jgi:hypothetical protein
VLVGRRLKSLALERLATAIQCAPRDAVRSAVPKLASVFDGAGAAGGESQDPGDASPFGALFLGCLAHGVGLCDEEAAREAAAELSPGAGESESGRAAVARMLGAAPFGLLLESALAYGGGWCWAPVDFVVGQVQERVWEYMYAKSNSFIH